MDSYGREGRCFRATSRSVYPMVRTVLSAGRRPKDCDEMIVVPDPRTVESWGFLSPSESSGSGWWLYRFEALGPQGMNSGI